MIRALIVFALFTVLLTGCGQGVPVPTPTATAAPSPTLVQEPTRTPLSGSDQRFSECMASLVGPLLTRVEDDHKGLQYAWEEDIEEIRLWLERLETDADEARETLQRECPLPDNPDWQQARDLLVESMRELSSGARQMHYEFTLDTLFEPDHRFEPHSGRYGQGIEAIENGVRSYNEAIALLGT